MSVTLHSYEIPFILSFEIVPGDVLTWVRARGVTSRGSKSPVLKELNVATWDQTMTSAAVYPSPLLNTELGARGESREGICNGDSGGPLTIEENGTARLVGLAVWVIRCGLGGKPGVYERVSTSRDLIEPYLPK
ncbi:hypothetical protein DYB31_014732 [Aphanomyces astaci]|uniref:Peptidase S1 domain-containing protein n=2 Tax=Aphanomyces astaci TaxID=112090 RepID=A0A397EPF5_APHAT|nr:hypothetical protein DYB31_014732 [Aphanomyces astaci]